MKNPGILGACRTFGVEILEGLGDVPGDLFHVQIFLCSDVVHVLQQLVIVHCACRTNTLPGSETLPPQAELPSICPCK